MPKVTSTDGTTHVGDLRVGNLVWAHMMPLRHRLSRGEGLLLAVNLSVIAVARPSAALFVGQALVSIAVLSLLYLLNDVYDAPRDVHDQGKNQTFVNYLVRNRQLLGWMLAGEHLALITATVLTLGLRAGLAVIVVCVVNLLYSVDFKSRVALDVPWVALWGASYVVITGVDLPFTVFATVGCMTAIAQIFQITRDRIVDRVNGIRTSAVAVPWLPTVQMALACTGMGLCLTAHLPIWVGISAVIPLLLYRMLPSNDMAWFAARAYYGVVWLLLLRTFYVG